jgi:hypothetical protein
MGVCEAALICVRSRDCTSKTKKEESLCSGKIA